jgi:hypothetical protein
MLKRQSWTTEDDFILRHIYPSASDSEVAKQMQRTQWSIKSRAKRLHLTKDAEYRASLDQIKTQRLSVVGAGYPIRVDRGAVTLLLTSPQMFADLDRYGVIPHKSALATYPHIGRAFTSDFVRGVFEGDGCITTSVIRQSSVTIIGTEPFCYWLQATTQREIGIRSAVYHKKNTTFRWVIGARGTITSFARWMYRAEGDGSLPVHLERKYARFVSASLI